MVQNNNQTPDARDQVLTRVVDELCTPASYAGLAYYTNYGFPMPSLSALREIVENLRAVLFPGYFGFSELNQHTMRYYIGSTLSNVAILLQRQIKCGLCFTCGAKGVSCGSECEDRARVLTTQFLDSLPQIRHLLSTDVMAAYTGDPAAKSPGETIFCYPSIRALLNQRIAHKLYSLNVPLIPRIITEMAHSETGIDIHPGAEIGESFFMDHGTGIVIGETSVIGKNVRLYQGVTLGAKSFPLDEHGNPIKGIPRHPVLEDDVIIYSNATILGRIIIGKGSVIGGNVWLTHAVPPNSKVAQGGDQNSLKRDSA